MNENSTEFDMNAEFNKYADTFFPEDTVNPEQTEDDYEDNSSENKPEESDTSSPNQTEEEKEDHRELPVDYQDLYLKERQRAAAHTELLNSRLNSMAKQYQELKSKKETIVEPEEDEPIDKLPTNVRDLFEIHPEIADAMKSYVNHQLRKTMTKLDTAVDSKVQPLASHMQYTEAQRHEAIIRSAHPDVSAIMDSGDLLVWINSLDAISRTGAMQIYQNGTAEDIVSMLDAYKQTRGVRTKSKLESAKPVEKDTPAYDSSSDNTSDTEAIVKKVMAAMNVPSSKPPMDIQNAKPKKNFDPNAEFDRLVRTWEKNKY